MLFSTHNTENTENQLKIGHQFNFSLKEQKMQINIEDYGKIILYKYLLHHTVHLNLNILILTLVWVDDHVGIEYVWY